MVACVLANLWSVRIVSSPVGPLDAATGSAGAVGAHPLLDVDLDTTHGVHQGGEPPQVDDDGVVDPLTMKVWGVDGLRVCDASAMRYVTNGKGELREDFDIIVHDGSRNESKSLKLVSGGERVWISCRSRHEVHYAENPDMPSSRSGRRPCPCNCAAGTCEAMRHNTSGFGGMSTDARGGKSLSLMSGGERTFIDACLTRAIALYLAQNTGRRFDTLFSDEADGPLDPEHKRMFMAMKREVLRLGGYRQEFFITQTPHLATMADAIIDLDAMRDDAHSDDALVAEVART